ncbi:TniQ family protein [Vibrio cholerae]|uniref:TniQ family protein n=1 Tax=Vibrio TaxID=662 RepID=UPI00192AAB4F|nr:MULTISPECIES: TniQ family protein [Vibrio]EGR4229193.1 hypothetical protein [Vibrio cholerae]EGR4328089.1 hypothetical protein [Vibrio cholerae]EJK2190754.1 TniQ family protein [Vibrio cholerae]EKF9461025.1 TniQ family protein [Vibrio cholerae]EKO3966125.1 hypothetical protein [Vibrio fluvialis]
MKTMLLQRPKPFEDESLESYLIRIANRNGYQDVDRFLSALKHYLCDGNSEKFSSFPTDIRRINPYSSKHSSAARSHALQKIGQLTFTESVDLLKLAINRSPLKYSPSVTALIRGHEVFPRSLLRTNIIPVCPVCLQENGYASYLWHFEGYDYCHIHDLALTYNCQCGKPYDYRVSGLQLVCSSCGTTLNHLLEKPTDRSSDISHWLAGETIKWLPAAPVSYRWGLVHWWMNNKKSKELETESFTIFWENWPDSFHNLIHETLSYNQTYSLVAPNQWRLKDLLGEILFNSINLPGRNLQYNLILRELFHYLENHLWENNGLIANLRLSAFEVSLILGCSTEEVASMSEQGLLIPMQNRKRYEPMSLTNCIFHFGDVFCLWLAEFQTDEFNRSFYTSRW